jgi:hypothetical protein
MILMAPSSGFSRPVKTPQTGEQLYRAWRYLLPLAICDMRLIGPDKWL